MYVTFFITLEYYCSGCAIRACIAFNTLSGKELQYCEWGQEGWVKITLRMIL